MLLIFPVRYFARVPMNILGSIIIVSVASLVEYEQAVYLWKVDKLDLLCWLAACFGVLFYRCGGWQVDRRGGVVWDRLPSLTLPYSPQC